MRLGRWGWQVSTGPIGGVAIGVELVVSETVKSFKIQEQTRETSYKQSLRGNAYKGGR
jgi:hypothetical protein